MSEEFNGSILVSKWDLRQICNNLSYNKFIDESGPKHIILTEADLGILIDELARLSEGTTILPILRVSGEVKKQEVVIYGLRINNKVSDCKVPLGKVFNYLLDDNEIPRSRLVAVFNKIEKDMGNK
jgi:hypothetical protein